MNLYVSKYYAGKTSGKRDSESDSEALPFSVKMDYNQTRKMDEAYRIKRENRPHKSGIKMKFRRAARKETRWTANTSNSKKQRSMTTP